MASLFRHGPPTDPQPGRSLPPEMCQLIVNLKAEYPGFSLREISTICFLRFGRKLSHHTIQRVLADGPASTVAARRYPAYAEIADGYQRRRAIVDLHVEGWSITAISCLPANTSRHGCMKSSNAGPRKDMQGWMINLRRRTVLPAK